jgi:hypothetical protein
MGASGCGAIKGETTRQTVHLNNLSLPESLVPIEVESFSSAPDAAELYTSGVKRWGKFNDADLTNLRASLEDTLKAAISQDRLDNSEKVRVYVVIRNYLVAASNIQGATLAAVDWCAARKDGTLLYREIFYAANSGMFIGTLGSMKDTVHRSIVGRIAESSLLLASRNRAVLTLPRNTKGTFDKLEDARKTLPGSVASLGFLAVQDLVYIPGSSPVNVPWQSVETANSVSCNKSLGGNELPRNAAEPAVRPETPTAASREVTVAGAGLAGNGSETPSVAMAQPPRLVDPAQRARVEGYIKNNKREFELAMLDFQAGSRGSRNHVA